MESRKISRGYPYCKFSCVKSPLRMKYFPKYAPETSRNILESGHEKMCLMSYANNKGADQPAHPRSLISAFDQRFCCSLRR